jgi:phosphopantothenoylcysteine decarboxylase / phosphopantothenate---cysteine ligase
MSLNGKRILLGVTGGIAAYKACALTSQLTKAGTDVHVMMTPGAKQFVTPQTFQALSRNPVHDDVFTEKNENQIAHIDLADHADLVIIVPATANIIAKLAHGQASDMVTTTVLATKAPVWVAPAMNVNMYQHPAVKKNIETLKEWGYRVLDAGVGTLACGWVGEGRLMEPEAIFDKVNSFFSIPTVQDLAGKRILISAGPTMERIDPVRYLTNRSTGKMGYAIAEAARLRGADVTLVSGPTELSPPDGVHFIQVESARDMYEAVINRYQEMDAVIKTAAVSDYRSKTIATQKMKKSDNDLVLELERNPDILEELGRNKTNQVLIGFAAETNDIETYAKRKLEKKNLEMVVANDVSRADTGFGAIDNQVSLYYRNGEVRHLEKMSKLQVASIICDELKGFLEKRGSE